eukprot:jgi/Hompol1/3721/HPOL_003336-RA
MGFDSMSLPEVLDDLASRFILNIPEDELQSIQRICFQIEQAHWYYEDFVRELQPKLPSFPLKQFSLTLFKRIPLLSHWANDHELAFQQFLQYKTLVPVCGAIILNSSLSKVLLVRGWKSTATWSFPRGKINQEESEISCALREVYEEIGFDASPNIRSNEYIERTISEQKIRLYIIAGIPETTVFTTQTRKEIGDIRWFDLRSIPGYSSADSDGPQKAITSGTKKQKFFMVTAFAGALRRWRLRYGWH